MERENLTLRDCAELLRCMGHPVRLAIVQRLAAGPRCVTDIGDLLGRPQANVSQHLSALRSHRIVDYYEDGKLRCYYLARPKLARLLTDLLTGGYGVVRPSQEQVRRDARRVLDAAVAVRSRHGRKALRENNLSNYGAGILTVGEAPAPSIPCPRVCKKRATKPAAKRTSQNAQVIFSRCLSYDGSHQLTNQLDGGWIGRANDA